MKTKILLLIMVTLCSVILIAQNAHLPGNQPTFRLNLDEGNDGQSGLTSDEETGVDAVSSTKSLVAYAYRKSGGTQGPCYFELDKPGTITLLAPGTSFNWIAAGTWADGKWYGEEDAVGNLYEINPFDGSMTFIGSCGANISGMAWDDTTMYACTATDFGSIDLEDGSATLIGPMGNQQYMVGMACDSAGNIYGIDCYDENLYSINKTTGAATIIGYLGFDIQGPQDIEFDKDNNVLYLTGNLPGVGRALYTINTGTGAATLVGGFMNNAEMDAIAIPYGVPPVSPDDVGIVSITSPSSGTFLTDEEPVVVLINNFGTNAQSDFNVSFTVDGGTPVTETITAIINGGESYEYSFTAMLDLSALGEYTIEVCTDLVGDNNPENNCTTKIVINSGLDYCDATTGSPYESISNVLCGSFNNPSGWQAGVADYTGISTTIEPGMSEEINLINGYPQAGDAAAAWVDWNNDTVFQLNSVEEFHLTNDGTNEIFTGNIEVPAGTANGQYRMRVRLVRNVAPDPCGLATYGEIEDYTIIVDSIDVNIENNLLQNTQVYPNPASGLVNIKSDNPIIYISVFNQTGQEVFSVEPNSSFYQLNTSNFISGVYHFLIKKDEGSVSRRIVIH